MYCILNIYLQIYSFAVLIYFVFNALKTCDLQKDVTCVDYRVGFHPVAFLGGVYPKTMWTKKTSGCSCLDILSMNSLLSILLRSFEL